MGAVPPSGAKIGQGGVVHCFPLVPPPSRLFPKIEVWAAEHRLAPTHLAERRRPENGKAHTDQECRHESAKAVARGCAIVGDHRVLLASNLHEPHSIANHDILGA